MFSPSWPIFSPSWFICIPFWRSTLRQAPNHFEIADRLQKGFCNRDSDRQTPTHYCFRMICHTTAFQERVCLTTSILRWRLTSWPKERQLVMSIKECQRTSLKKLRRTWQQILPISMLKWQDMRLKGEIWWIKLKSLKRSFRWTEKDHWRTERCDWRAQSHSTKPSPSSCWLLGYFVECLEFLFEDLWRRNLVEEKRDRLPTDEQWEGLPSSWGGDRVYDIDMLLNIYLSQLVRLRRIDIVLVIFVIFKL